MHVVWQVKDSEIDSPFLSLSVAVVLPALLSALKECLNCSSAALLNLYSYKPKQGLVMWKGYKKLSEIPYK